MISKNMSDKALNIEVGNSKPLGVTTSPQGVNFALFTKHATSVTLCLFSPENISLPLHEILLEPSINKTGNVWHIFIQGIPPDLLYAFRLKGAPTPPNVYNEELNLIDPYAKMITTSNQWGHGKKFPYTPLGIATPELNFDWENDKPPQIPLNDLIIYEMHVRGFTQDPSSEAEHPGTFLGLAEKVQHLVDLGVNAVELLPIFEFNECEYKKSNPATNAPLYNYWGYSTVNFFAPMQRYAFDQKQNAAITEFKTMVKILHRHGIEVILDVVYNHTAEGNQKGPTYSFKGIDNSVYYMFDSNNRSLDFTGCGNTFNCNHPDVQKFILESLRYWVTEMHVDGFRFDLTSIFARGPNGQVLPNPPLLEAIAKDPILSKIKLIAEPWDASGLFQLGLFAKKYDWSEWNGRYRDSVRKFIRGGGENGIFVTNLCGSQDIFYSQGPASSINFVTAHDGFTLADLVSYNQKHNLENGEENRDGINYN
jgi:isoamylase